MTAPLLEVENVSKAFGHFVAVNNVSLAISEGHITALIGPNGAGKTTLYNMISGRLKPTAGSVRFRGTDITGLSPDRIVRVGISRSFQITNIFDELTVLENIQVALIARHNMGLNLWQVSARDK
ncbi:MAG: ATP-binding cassette domain-containing protein, partial [Candidatus Methylomirabilales bacterium]